MDFCICTQFVRKYSVFSANREVNAMEKRKEVLLIILCKLEKWHKIQSSMGAVKTHSVFTANSCILAKTTAYVKGG